MNFIIKTTPEELQRARKWWNDQELQWKFAYNEAVFGKGPTIEPPQDDELMILLIRADTLRFAGPLAPRPNMSTMLTNLSGLIPLYHLKYLSLTHTHVTSLRELVRHTQMEHLFVYNNKLTSLQGIEGMYHLKDLYAQYNELEDILPIQKLTKLETIYVSGNKLNKLDGLTKKHVGHLKKFYVQPNENLPDREILRVQNEIGIICRQG